MSSYPTARWTRRSLLRAGGALCAAAALPRFAFADEQAGARHLAGRLVRVVGVHRHHRTAYRHLCRAGRGRAEGYPARDRAHQQRRRPDQEDLAEDHKGVLGKEVKYGVADSEAKPNTAVQEQSHFISENKIVVMMRLDLERGRGGAEQIRRSASSALHHRRLGLERHDRQGLRPLRLPPVLLRPDRRGRDRAGHAEGYGKDKKAAYLTPDYTYGHTVQKSMEDFLARTAAGPRRPTRSPRSARPDYSSYLLNMRQFAAPSISSTSTGATTRCCRRSRRSSSASSTR